MSELLWPDVAVEPRLTAPHAERYVRSYLLLPATAEKGNLPPSFWRRYHWSARGRSSRR